MYVYIHCIWKHTQYTFVSLVYSHQKPDCCAKTVLVSLAWGWSLHPINWKLVVVSLVIPKVWSSKSTGICCFLVETHQCGTLLLFSLLLAVVDWNNNVNYTQQLHELVKNTGARKKSGCLSVGAVVHQCWQLIYVRRPGFNLKSITFSWALCCFKGQQWLRFDSTQ